MSPAAIALLVAAAKRIQNEGLNDAGSEVVPPVSRSAMQYLQRMDVFRHLVGDALPESFQRRPPHGFRPCIPFSTDDECHACARQLRDVVTEACETDSVGASSVHICLDELCENVMHHADTQHGGFAVAQA